MDQNEREVRLKQLRAALIRVAKGRPHNPRNGRMSISSVAREAGVSASLVHNCYPEILEEIRKRSARIRACEKVPTPTRSASEVAELRRKVAQLASINETLLVEVRALRAQLDGGMGASIVSMAGIRRTLGGTKPTGNL